MNYQILETKIGDLTLISDGEALIGLYFGVVQLIDGVEKADEVLVAAKIQLGEYFDGKRREFDLPLNPKGTVFQRKAWDALCTIPYGETRAYSDMAVQIGNPKACRAVGLANNRNPISIVIPCHRVIGKDKSLVGYGGGLERKEYLLALEADCLGNEK
jgi:methylated-DNA-[protein]-cysteine S-methyltransferase